MEFIYRSSISTQLNTHLFIYAPTPSTSPVCTHTHHPCIRPPFQPPTVLYIHLSNSSICTAIHQFIHLHVRQCTHLLIGTFNHSIHLPAYPPIDSAFTPSLPVHLYNPCKPTTHTSNQLNHVPIQSIHQSVAWTYPSSSPIHQTHMH